MVHKFHFAGKHLVRVYKSSNQWNYNLYNLLDIFGRDHLYPYIEFFCKNLQDMIRQLTLQNHLHTAYKKLYYYISHNLMGMVRILLFCLRKILGYRLYIELEMSKYYNFLDNLE